MWYVSRPPQNKGMSRISIRIRLGFTNFAECSLGFLPDFGRMWIPSYCPMDESHSTPTCFATFTLPETNIALEHRPNNKTESSINFLGSWSTVRIINNSKGLFCFMVGLTSRVYSTTKILKLPVSDGILIVHCGLTFGPSENFLGWSFCYKKTTASSRWWFQKYFLFSPLFGEDSHF